MSHKNNIEPDVPVVEQKTLYQSIKRNETVDPKKEELHAVSSIKKILFLVGPLLLMMALVAFRTTSSAVPGEVALVNDMDLADKDMDVMDIRDDDAAFELYKAQMEDYEKGMSMDDLMEKYDGGPSAQSWFPCCTTVNIKCQRSWRQNPMNPNTGYWACHAPLMGCDGDCGMCGPQDFWQSRCCGSVGRKRFFWERCASRG